MYENKELFLADGETGLGLFDILAEVLQGDTLSIFLFTIVFDNALRSH